MRKIKILFLEFCKPSVHFKKKIRFDANPIDGLPTCIELDNLNLARKFFADSIYASSGVVYSWLDQKYIKSIYAANIDISHRRMIPRFQSSSIASLFKRIGIEKVYVLNLSRRVDRKVRMATEFSRHDIFPFFINAVDALSSEIVSRFACDHTTYCAIPNKWDAHLDPAHRSSIAHRLTKGAVAYKLSQKLIFESALNNNYKKIAVFDDDIFFSINALKILDKFFYNYSREWKVVALGASDDLIYRNKYDQNFVKNVETIGYYHPKPGNTCGSFAMLYDRSVFSDLIEAAQYPSGTFDNTALGAMYAKYPDDCFVLFPNVVTPSVIDSDIRHSRAQLEHSKRMFWDLSRYRSWSSDINIYIVSDDNPNFSNESDDSRDDKGICIKYLSVKEAVLLQTPIDHVVRMSRDEFIVDGSVYTALCDSLSRVKSPYQYFSFFVYIS